MKDMAYPSEDSSDYFAQENRLKKIQKLQTKCISICPVLSVIDKELTLSPKFFTNNTTKKACYPHLATDAKASKPKRIKKSNDSLQHFNLGNIKDLIITLVFIGNYYHYNRQ